MSITRQIFAEHGPAVAEADPEAKFKMPEGSTFYHCKSVAKVEVDGEDRIRYDAGWGHYDAHPGEVVEVEYAPKTTREEALAIVLDAAASWSNELVEYIAPAASDKDDAASYQAQANAIDEALQILQPKAVA